jgi:hypothetical protein
MIVADIDKITKKTIQEAHRMRIERLAKEHQESDQLQGQKRKLEEYVNIYDSTPITDVVFRVMTWEHVPQQPSKNKGTPVLEEVLEDADVLEEEIAELLPKMPAKYVKVNFPPFQHYRISEDLTPVLVGKSHWQGDLHTGHFSTIHGAMTAKLAHMFIKLCERYATRSNWRGYTYNDEMRSQALLQLTYVGLQFNEAKSQNPFAYYTAAVTNSFTRILNVEKRNQNIRDDILEMNNYTPSYTRQGEWGNGGWGPDE